MCRTAGSMSSRSPDTSRNSRSPTAMPRPYAASSPARDRHWPRPMRLRSIVRYSPSARVSRAMLRIIRHKRNLDSPERVRRDIDRRMLRPESYAPPRRVQRRVDISVEIRHDWRCYELTPPGEEPDVRVLYLHGGAYIEEISALQWTAVAKLAVEAPARFIVPIYPLAPYRTAAATVETATQIASDLLAEHGPDVMLLGDSAGGGLALAIA